MANSKFEYVRSFETFEKLLPNTWIVVRIDGKNFHKFSNVHNFDKPNDLRSLNLMNFSAHRVFKEFKEDICICFGQSDEYSFVFRRKTEIFNRRHNKLLTYVNSLFTSAYVFNWKRYFPDQKLFYEPTFDARIILYPTNENLRDYLSWRQADTHINNLYNTAFWNLVLKKNLSNSEAEKRLCGTLSSDKNELLFSEFGINYNNEPKIFRKGTILLKKRIRYPYDEKFHTGIIPLHTDLIQDKFWEKHNEILTDSGIGTFEINEPIPELVSYQYEHFAKNKNK